jgi:hypothetical protein
VVTLTSEELRELRAEHGDAAVREHFENETKNVFGANYQRDKNGKPIEQGVGSPEQPSKNSVDAYEKWHRDDVDFATRLAEMKAALAKYEARRAAERRGE